MSQRGRSQWNAPSLFALLRTVNVKIRFAFGFAARFAVALICFTCGNIKNASVHSQRRNRIESKWNQNEIELCCNICLCSVRQRTQRTIANDNGHSLGYICCFSLPLCENVQFGQWPLNFIRISLYWHGQCVSLSFSLSVSLALSSLLANWKCISHVAPQIWMFFLMLLLLFCAWKRHRINYTLITTSNILWNQSHKIHLAPYPCGPLIVCRLPKRDQVEIRDERYLCEFPGFTSFLLLQRKEGHIF